MDIPHIFTIETLLQLDAEFHYMVFGQGITLVIAEPSVTKRKTLLNDLKKVGYDNVFDATKGSEALALAKKTQDIVGLIVANDLPDTDGVKLAQSFLEVCPNGVVILLTEKSTKELNQRAVDAGVRAVLEKTATTETICQKLREAGLRVK